jgi:hypothetical protein
MPALDFQMEVNPNVFLTSSRILIFSGFRIHRCYNEHCPCVTTLKELVEDADTEIVANLYSIPFNISELELLQTLVYYRDKKCQIDIMVITQQGTSTIDFFEFINKSYRIFDDHLVFGDDAIDIMNMTIHLVIVETHSETSGYEAKEALDLYLEDLGDSIPIDIQERLTDFRI